MNWHQIQSNYAEGTNLFNDAQVGAIGAMKPEICTKCSKNLSEKLTAKFPVTTLSYSIVTIAHLDNAFSGIFGLEASPVRKMNHCLKSITKGEKEIKKEKPKDVGHFLVQKSEILIYANGR